jgi:hypothetical protein
MRSLFHLAFPVKDLKEARKFYVEILGCREGRSSDTWIDFDLYGHQIVAHLASDLAGRLAYNDVDKDAVPVPHFGVILEMHEWKNLAERLKQKHVKFVIEPKIRFSGQAGEQATMFFLDPSGNALEFKAFEDFSKIFEK